MENHGHEVHITVRSPRSLTLQRAYDLYRQEVLIPLRRKYKTLVTAVTVLTPGRRGDVLGELQPHLHSLVTTVDRCLPHDPAGLAELAVSLQKKKSKLLDHRAAIVITPYAKDAHPGYLAGHLIHGTEAIELYGLEVLKTTQL
jgi:hypothetical protein